MSGAQKSYLNVLNRRLVMINKQLKVTVPISEYDLEVFKGLVYDNLEPFSWTFTTDSMDTDVTITFVPEEEEDD